MGNAEPPTQAPAVTPRPGPAVAPIWHERADRLVARLHAIGCGRQAPRAGQLFPDIMLPDWQGRLTRLSELCATGPIVLSFHRGLWCPWCRAELDSWRAAQPDMRAAGCRLVLVTPETGAHAAAMAAEAGFAAQVLCDVDFGASAGLGLAFYLGQEYLDAFASAGLDLGAHYGAVSGILPIPATFVVEVGRRVRFAHVDPDFRHRADPAAVLASLRA